MSKHFDAVVAKNDLAEVFNGLMSGEYAELGELPLRQMIFDLQEIEAYTGQMNQPAIKDILEVQV